MIAIALLAAAYLIIAFVLAGFLYYLADSEDRILIPWRVALAAILWPGTLVGFGLWVGGSMAAGWIFEKLGRL